MPTPPSDAGNALERLRRANPDYVPASPQAPVRAKQAQNGAESSVRTQKPPATRQRPRNLVPEVRSSSDTALERLRKGKVPAPQSVGRPLSKEAASRISRISEELSKMSADNKEVVVVEDEPETEKTFNVAVVFGVVTALMFAVSLSFMNPLGVHSELYEANLQLTVNEAITTVEESLMSNPLNAALERKTFHSELGLAGVETAIEIVPVAEGGDLADNYQLVEHDTGRVLYDSTRSTDSTILNP